MKVQDVMGTAVITVLPQATYEEAARIMHDHKLSGLPVVDGEGNLVGMISEKDLFKALYPLYHHYILQPEVYLDQEAQENEINDLRTHPVERYMIRKVLTVELDAPILRAGGIMLAYNVHRLPVVERGKLVGIVTREDIYGAILKHHLDL